jgi:hypothetical protein
VTKIVESKVWNRTLVCFRSDAVNSRQRADVRTIHFDDRLVGRSTGKNEIAFHFFKPSSQDRTSLLGERDFASGCLCLAKRVEEIRKRQAGSGSRLCDLQSSVFQISTDQGLNFEGVVALFCRPLKRARILEGT